MSPRFKLKHVADTYPSLFLFAATCFPVRGGRLLARGATGAGETVDARHTVSGKLSCYPALW